MAKEVMEEFIGDMKEYLAVSGVEQRRKDLVHTIHDILSHFLKKNTALMGAFCYDPLFDAIHELRMEVQGQPST